MNNYFENSFNVLVNIFKNKAYSVIELNKALKEMENEGDKAKLTKIVYGVLEKNLKLEYIIKQFTTKKPKLNAHIILKIGTYASLHLNSVPSYAVVNELVNLAKEKTSKFEVGFINKTLKNIINKSYKMVDKSKLLEYLSITYSVPLWMVRQLKVDYGLKHLEKLLSYKSGKLTNIRVNLNLTTIQEFKNILTKNKIKFRESLFENALKVDYRALIKHKKLNSFYTAQSLGSMLIASSFNFKENAQIIDVCSAPGGKACYMAEINSNGKVLALDLHEHRVELIKKYASRMQIKNVETAVGDATKLNQNYVNKFDYLLVDAPCSGLGVFSKKPDILLFKTEENIKQLTALQRNILQTASSYVKVGGELIYSTCTLLKCENNAIINEFLSKNKGFEVIKVKMPKVEHLNINNTILLLPDQFNNEGYFIAKLKRIK